MDLEELSPHAIKSNLTWRYAVAVCLVAAMFILSSIIINDQISSQEEDAYIINISGMQRMLSQRIALLSNTVSQQEDSLSSEMFKDLKERIARMKKNHAELTSGNLSHGGRYILGPEIRDLYFGDDQLDILVKNYIQSAENYVSYLENGEGLTQAALGEYNTIRNTAQSQLLPLLNQAVTIYQEEAEAKISIYQSVEIILLLTGLSILVLEVLFIFRPMANMVYTNVDKLNKANNELLEFTYRISHDLRAPATSAKGLAHVALSALEKGKNDTVEKSLRHVENAMLKMEALVDDILNLTRMKSEGIQAEAIDIEEMVNSIIKKYEPISDKQNVNMDVQINLNEPVITSRFFLQQTLENLISNALKYSDAEEEQSFINISAEKKKNIVVFRITDNGLGIDEEYRKDIFGMFKRFHPKVSFGSGLGLYLVKQNVTKMNGDIEYEPEEKGSTFIVTIPAVG